MTSTRACRAPRGTVGVDLFSFPSALSSGVQVPLFGVAATGASWASQVAAFEGPVHARVNAVQEYGNFEVPFPAATAGQVNASGRTHVFTLQPSTGQFNLSGAVRASDGTTVDSPMVPGTSYAALVTGTGSLMAASVTQPSGTYVTLGAVSGGPSGLTLSGSVPAGIGPGVHVPLTAPFTASSAASIAYTHDYPGLISGNYDAAFAAMAQAAAGATLVRFAHEMNGSWYPWCVKSPSGITPAGYVSMWTRARSAWQAAETAASLPHAPWAWCPNISNNTSTVPAASGTQGGGTSGSTFPIYAPPSPGAAGTGNSCYPGDSQVEWIGIDGYSSPSSSVGPNPSFTALATADLQWIRQAVSAVKPLMVCETGTDASLGAGRGAWFPTLFSTLGQCGVSGVIYFNSSSYVITSDLGACQGLLGALEAWARP